MTEFLGYPGDPSLNHAVIGWCEHKLLAQGWPSFHEGNAWYRSPTGLRDPAGWLIPDADYHEWWESCPVYHTSSLDQQEIGEYFIMKGFDLGLVTHLIVVHDDHLRVNLQRTDIREDWREVWVGGCESARTIFCV